MTVSRQRRRKLARSRQVVYRRPPLYREQEDAIFAESRYVVIEASTKTGKTTGCIAWLFEQAVRDGYPGYMGWWVAPIFRQAAIAYTRLKRYAAGWVKPNDTRLELALPNGAVIVFRGADKPDSLYGDDCHAAVLDESTRMKQAAWIAMRSQLSATGGWVRLIGNVRGSKNWAYKLGRTAKAGAKNHHYARLTCWHAVAAGIMDVQEVLEAQAQMPPHAFQELYLAEPSDDGSNPFGLGNIEACCVRSAELLESMQRSTPVVWGIDLAKSVDWTVAIALNDYGHVCRVVRFQMPWRDALPRLRRLVGTTPALIDSTGVGNPVVEFLQAPSLLTQASPAEVKAMLDLAHAVRDNEVLEERVRDALQSLTNDCPNIRGYGFTAASKQRLMEGLAVAIQTRSVQFPAGTFDGGLMGEFLKDELDAFEFQYTGRDGQAGAVRYSAPEGMHDDGVIALALAWQAYTSQNRWQSAGGALVTL